MQKEARLVCLGSLDKNPKWDGFLRCPLSAKEAATFQKLTNVGDFLLAVRLDQCRDPHRLFVLRIVSKTNLWQVAHLQAL